VYTLHGVEEAFTQYRVYTASCIYQSHFCPKEMGKSNAHQNQ